MLLLIVGPGRDWPLTSKDYFLEWQDSRRLKLPGVTKKGVQFE